MRSSIFILLLLFSSITLFDTVSCELSQKIHFLNNDIFQPQKHDMTSNLRTHNAYYGSSSNSIGGAFVGFIFGPILFFMAFICIWFNEKRAVIDYRRLKLAEQICQDVNPLRRDEITAAHMKLTHISGNSTTNQTIGDRLSNISANGAIKINRSVQVMQWRATTNQRNGYRQVTYNLGWQSSNISNVEGRPNPVQNWFVKSETIYNQKVFVGQYLLSQSQKDLCLKANPMTPDMNHANQILANTHRTSRPVIQDGYIYFPSPQSGSISDAGALRLKYSYCPVGPISLMAKTVSNSFEAFPIAQYEGNGKIQKNQLPACCCISNCIAELLKPIEEINLVEEEIQTKNQMITGAVQKSKLYTIIIRVVCYFLMVFGICWFFSPITIIIGYIPLVGGILKGTVGFIIFVAALLICIPLFILAFSLAWLWYHPKVGAVIFAVGLLILGIILFINYSRKGDAGGAVQSAQVVKHLMRSWTHQS